MVFGAPIRQPIPTKHTFDADSDVVQIGENQVKKHLGIGFDVLKFTELLTKNFQKELHNSDIWD